VGPDKTQYGAVARPSATLALLASGGHAFIDYPLDSIPNAITDLILVSLDNGRLMLAEGIRSEALAGVAFSRVQVATLSSSHISHTCITPFDLPCHELRHYANDIGILRHGVGPLGKAKDAFLWRDRQWVLVETETPSDDDDDEGEEQQSDGFIVSDAEAEQEHISIEEEEEEEEEDPFQSGESESPEENFEEDHTEPHIESRRQSARATKRRLDDTSERLLHIEKKRPAAATAATKPPKDGRMCSICLTEPSDHVIYPCGHSAFCDGCFRNPQLNSSVCPLCKAKAELVMSIEMHAKISSMIVYWS
jgi:rubrerythrin